MRKLGCGAWILGALVLVAAGLVVGDVLLRGVVERRMAEEIAARTPGTEGVQVAIDSFPFVGRLALGGEVERITISARRTRLSTMQLSDVRVVVTDVRLDTGAALGGDARVRDIGEGSVHASIAQAELDRRLPRGFTTRLQDGRAVVRAPAGVEAELVAGDEGLLLRSRGRVVAALPLPPSSLLPCRPDVAFVTGAVRLSCTFDEVPANLFRVAR